MATEVVADSLGDEWKVSYQNLFNHIVHVVHFQHLNVSRVDG